MPTMLRCQTLNDLGGWACLQPVQSLDRILDTKVVCRQNVWSAKREHQKHVGSPAANSSDGDQLLAYVTVR